MCLQLFRLTIIPIWFCDIRNSSAIALWESSPREWTRLISLTISTVSFDLPLEHPTGCPALPLASLSLILSELFPRNKWDGFTHFGLSQLCRINNPPGIAPWFIIHAMRCAETFWPRCLNCPYPIFPPNADFQFQHSSRPRMTTLIQNLLLSFSDISFIEPLIRADAKSAAQLGCSE